MDDIPSLLEKAVRIAVEAHKDQKRKDGPPYIIHPFGVALKLAKYGFSDTVVAAALVHDVLEDTEYPPDTMHAELGDEVWAIIQSVTNDDSLSWEDKKLKYIETVRAGSDDAKAVATGDKIHNMESLVIAYKEHGDTLWTKFNANKVKKLWFEEKMLAMLKESWSHPMIQEYESLVAWMRSL
ncbi:MAG: HD domain-containing protein [Patescibacteria group bacterium]